MAPLVHGLLQLLLGGLQLLLGCVALLPSPRPVHAGARQVVLLGPQALVQARGVNGTRGNADGDGSTGPATDRGVRPHHAPTSCARGSGRKGSRGARARVPGGRARAGALRRGGRTRRGQLLAGPHGPALFLDGQCCGRAVGVSVRVSTGARV